MNLRRLSSSLAAAALIAGLAGAAPAGLTSANGGLHRQDTGWGFTARQADTGWGSVDPTDTGWGSVDPTDTGQSSINDTGWGLV